MDAASVWARRQEAGGGGDPKDSLCQEDSSAPDSGTLQREVPRLGYTDTGRRLPDCWGWVCVSWRP